MNGDEVKSAATKVALVVLGHFSGRYHLSGDQVLAIATDVGAGATFLYGMYAHWGMKKVAETAKVIGGMLLAAMLVSPQLARAGDFPKARAAFALPMASCTVTACTGFYAGAGVNGIGQSADIIGQGFQALTAGGSIIDIHAGGIYYNGTYLAGVEAGVGYQMSMGVNSALDSARGNAYVDFQLGGTLTSLFGTPAPAATPSPVFSIGNLMSQSVPFIHMGNWWRGSNAQTETGAGIMLPLTQGWFLKTTYTYGMPMNGMQQFNMGMFSVNRLF